MNLGARRARASTREDLERAIDEQPRVAGGSER